MTGGRSNAGLRKRHALQLFKTDMCKFFLHSRCENGDRCSYAHNIEEVRQKPDLTRTSMCRSMMQSGTCTDSSCRFAHSEAELRATHGFFKMKMCGFAQSGRCKHGQNCRFAHCPEELRPARPPPPGTEEDLLARQEEEPSAARAGLGHRAAALPAQEFDMSGFTFGAMRPQAAAPLPELSHTEAISNRRQARRQIGEVSGGQQASTRIVRSPKAEWCGPDRGPSASRHQVVKHSAGAGAGIHSNWNESDSADGSSWVSGSSVTEVPRSEHTGSPPTTSDSSSGNGTGSTSQFVASGGASASSEQRSKTQNRRPPRDVEAANNVPKVTTLLITNIPTYLTQGALLSMFEDLTYAMRGNFDFYYCPWDERMGQNLGYALLNFEDPTHAAAFQQTWSNKELCKGGRGQKPLKVLKAAVQGAQANLEYFSKVEIAPCTDLRFRPLFRDTHGILQPLQLNNYSSALSETPNPDNTMRELSEWPPTPFANSLACEGIGQDCQSLDSQPFTQHHARGSVYQEASSQSNVPDRHTPRARRLNRRGAGNASGGESRAWLLQQQQQQQQQQLQQLQQQPQGRGISLPGGRHAEFQDVGRREQHTLGMPFTGFTASGCQGRDLNEVTSPMTTVNIQKDFWGKLEEGNIEAAGGQVRNWPVMMTAVPWPMTEEQQQQQPQPDGSEGTCGFQGSSQEMLLVSSTDAMGSLGTPGSSTGLNSGQMQYPHLVPYMMMPMEAMVPLDGGQIDQSSIPQLTPGNMVLPSHMPICGWQDNNEVYTD